MGGSPSPQDAFPSFFQDIAERIGGQQQQLFRQQRPITNLLGGQIEEALRTGGVGAQVPIIQRAVGSQKQATSQALRRTEGGLGTQNLQGTPFGQQILAQQRQAGAQQASQIPTQFAQQFIGRAQPFISGQQQAAGALGGPLSQQFGQLFGQLSAAEIAAKAQKAAAGIGAAGEAAGGIGGGIAAASDERVKEDITLIGESPTGIGIYTFRYKDQPEEYIGAIAQDVMREYPNAVTDVEGVLHVNYSIIDVPFRRLQ